MQENKVSFDDLVIRRNYLSKMSGKSVDSKIKKFENNIKITSDMMFNKFSSSFSRSGYTSDDVLSMSKLYSYYYFDLYNDDKNGNEKDEKNGLIGFIRQRVQYLAFVCERESINHNVSKYLTGFFAKTQKSVEFEGDAILGNPEEFGYRVVTKKEINEIKKSGRKVWKDKDGFDIIKISYYDKLGEEDYKNILYQDSQLKSPEEILLELQENERMQAQIASFEGKSMVDKIRYLLTISSVSKDKERKQSAQKLLRILKKKVRDERVARTN